MDYLRDVKPILAKHCVSCHGAEKPKGGLRLDTAAAALAGGRQRPGGRPRQGRREPADRGRHGRRGHERMPLKRPPLSDEQIATLRAWIDAGGRRPPPPRRRARRPPTHWAFVPPRAAGRAARSRTPGWVRNPIDRFILARLEKEGIRPSPEADRATLIRRLSLDLIGLPPTPAEVDAFLDRHPARRLRAAGRSPARLAALRRALGPALARPGPLRRLQRLQHRRPALDLAVPRLGHRRPQPRHAVRPVHHRAARRRPAARRDRSSRRSPPASTATR